MVTSWVSRIVRQAIASFDHDKVLSSDDVVTVDCVVIRYVRSKNKCCYLHLIIAKNAIKPWIAVLGSIGYNFLIGK
jgi:hypothetical protein